ncbi:hypothetical protein TIFTF001_020828 [Ficus carica]|uniref:Uncharacterized protein n=1 Tax=Ficus carica TaxID=3494 RepID=A0AA88AUF2_FICCA|nr:hypothetical protein TIFTF001_020828 [Ficus carica]
MSHETLDVESMVDKANIAFASSSSLRNDFGDLYDAVRAFIAHHCQLSEAKKEFESMQEMIARKNNLLARSNGKAKALSGCQTALNEAKKNVVVLVDRIEETRGLRKEHEEKLAQGDMEIDVLKEEHDKLKEAFEDTKVEHENIAKEVREKQKIVKN